MSANPSPFTFAVSPRSTSTLTVTGTPNAPILIGMALPTTVFSSGVTFTAAGYITAQLTGTPGGAGTYTVVSSAAIAAAGSGNFTLLADTSSGAITTALSSVNTGVFTLNITGGGSASLTSVINFLIIN
jgi:hypothetical protein